MPLDTRVRFDIQVKVEGLFSEIAKLIAGSVILLLGLLTFFELIHYSYFLVIIIIAWLYITGKLYDEYRNRIMIKLEGQDVSSARLLKIQNVIIDELEQELGNYTPENAIFSYKLLEKIDPGAISASINKLMRHNDNNVREYAQFKMNEIRGLSVSEDYIISFRPVGQMSNGKNIVAGLDLENLLKTGDISKIRISKLSKSSNVNDRLYAAELIGNASDKETTTYLLELLHDVNPKVRTAAIKAAEKNYDNEILNGLIDNLESPIYSNLALNTLLLIGDNTFKALESEFYKAGQNVQIMIKIVQIYGRIGGSRAIELLWNKIDYPDKILVTQVLTSLGDCGFKANVNQITRIKYAIESDVADIAWNLAAIDEIPDNQIGKQLREAIREENTHDIDHIYTLLAMLYDAKSIQLVKENIESGTSEGVTYAIELIDVFLSDDLKQKIIPVLDDINENEKARRLEIIFARQGLGAKEVLKYLINRDFNQTNRWSKACAIHQIGKMKIEPYLYDLIANLFNPDPLVMEISAQSIYQISEEQYHLHTKRLGIEKKELLDQVVMHGGSKKLRFDKILVLKEMYIFSKVPGRILASAVDAMEEIIIKEGDSFALDSIYGNSFYVIFEGELDYFEEGSIKRKIEKGEFVGELLDDESKSQSNIFQATKDSTILVIQKDKFYGLLSDNYVFAQSVMQYLYAS